MVYLYVGTKIVTGRNNSTTENSPNVIITVRIGTALLPSGAGGQTIPTLVSNAIGSQAKSMIQDAIKDEEWAPNAPITIEGGWMMNEYGKKGPVPVHIKGKSSTKPLIDTGALRQNCQYVIKKGKK